MNYALSTNSLKRDKTVINQSKTRSNTNGFETLAFFHNLIFEGVQIILIHQLA